MLAGIRRAHARCGGCIQLGPVVTKKRVSLHLDSSGVAGHVCVDCDQCGAFSGHNARPDFIIAANWTPQIRSLTLVEMTGGQVRSDCIKSLQSGATVCANSTWFPLPSDVSISFHILHHGKVHTANLTTRPVTFRSKKFRVHNVRQRAGPAELRDLV